MRLSGNDPWKSTGWIPVVSGNMSFTEVGKTQISRKFTVRNQVGPDGAGQTILIFGRKNLNDGWLPSWLRRNLEQIEARFYVLLALRSHPVGSRTRETLEGFIAFSVYPQKLQSIWERLNEDTQNASFDVSEDLDADPFCYFADVRISREGRCDLWLPRRYNPNTVLSVSRQFFIFIKDVSHHHYHHRRADSITYAHIHNDEMEWRTETLYSLHRAMVSARRFTSQARLRSALGISSYAETFEAGFLHERKLPDGGKFTAYSYEPIRTSINALLEDTRLRTERRLANIVVVSSIMLAFVALVVAAGEISRETAWPKWLISAVQFSVLHPGFTMLITFIGYIALLTAASQDNLFNRAGLWLGQWIYRRWAFVSQRWMWVTLMLVGGGLGYVAVNLFKYFWVLEAIKSAAGAP